MANTNKENELLIKMSQAMMEVVTDYNADELMKLIMPKIDAKIKEQYGFLPELHEIRSPKATHKIAGVVHEKFDQVLKMVNDNIPVFLTGKAGTGKNVICKQVAEALGLPFFFSNAVTQEYKLTGFIDANGRYQETQFYKAFTEGGLFFLDEIDASVTEVLIILNAAIANRYFDFPNGKVEANPNFRVIAAGNTVGRGADDNYTGRYCLDRASLDRFALVEIDYSQKIEESLAKEKRDLIDFAHAFRKAVDKIHIDCLFSYRTIERIANLEEIVPNIYENLQISLFKGLDEDDINMIQKELVDMPGLRFNKYVRSLSDHNLTTKQSEFSALDF